MKNQPKEKSPPVVAAPVVPPAAPAVEAPITYALGLVAAPQVGSRFWAVMVHQLQGDRVLRSNAWETIESKDLALDELQRVAVRIHYFGEGEQHMRAA